MPLRVGHVRWAFCLRAASPAFPFSVLFLRAAVVAREPFSASGLGCGASWWRPSAFPPFPPPASPVRLGSARGLRREMEQEASESAAGDGERNAEEPVVSLAEVLAENEELEKEARAVLGGSDHERCSYSQVRGGSVSEGGGRARGPPPPRRRLLIPRGRVGGKGPPLLVFSWALKIIGTSPFLGSPPKSSGGNTA